MRDDAGELLFTISDWVDPTTNRHIAAPLARSQATFESAFVDSPAGMSLRDKTFGAIRTNRAIQEILGDPTDPREGVFSVPEDDADFWRAVRDIREGRSTSFSRELKLTNSEGDTVWGLRTVLGISRTVRSSDSWSTLWTSQSSEWHARNSPSLQCQRRDSTVGQSRTSDPFDHNRGTRIRVEGPHR